MPTAVLVIMLVALIEADSIASAPPRRDVGEVHGGFHGELVTVKGDSIASTLVHMRRVSPSQRMRTRNT
jgi:hypothetical protein